MLAIKVFEQGSGLPAAGAQIYGIIPAKGEDGGHGDENETYCLLLSRVSLQPARFLSCSLIKSLLIH